MNTISYDALPAEVMKLRDQVLALENILSQITSKRQEDVYKNTKEAADFIKKTPNAIRILAFQKKIPCIKRGRGLYFKTDDLIKWMEEGRRGKTINVLK